MHSYFSEKNEKKIELGENYRFDDCNLFYILWCVVLDFMLMLHYSIFIQ